MFVSRHAMDGKFLFVDQRATLVLGFLPQELLGTSMYEYYRHEDIPRLAEAHKAALTTRRSITTQVYRFRSKEGSHIRLQSEWRSFRNPWTKEVEYLVAKNLVILSLDGHTVDGKGEHVDGSASSNLDFFSLTSGSMGGKEMQRLISNHVEAGKIGRQIAEAVLDSGQGVGGDGTREDGASDDEEGVGGGVVSPLSPPPSPHVPPVPSSSSEATAAPTDPSTPSLAGRKLGVSAGGISASDASSIAERRLNNAANCTTGAAEGSFPGQPPMTPPTPFNAVHRSNISVNLNSTVAQNDDEMMDMIAGTPMLPASPHDTGASTDGNDEAAMAVIMSLLEADAGLGGPVDFSGLPWPLP